MGGDCGRGGDFIVIGVVCGDSLGQDEGVDHAEAGGVWMEETAAEAEGFGETLLDVARAGCYVWLCIVDGSSAAA